MLEVEVGAAFGAVRRWWRICDGGSLVDWWDKGDLNNVRPMGARRLDGLGIIKGIVHRCDLGRRWRTNGLTHNDIGVVRTISESRLSRSGIVCVRGDDG